MFLVFTEKKTIFFLFFPSRRTYGKQTASKLTFFLVIISVNSAWLSAFIGYNIGCKPGKWFIMSFK